ncbi:MAG: redox-sensing transcriptional repressor Rex [Planctomycetes bacterium]|nr:redox-sensing transcriptional repressor Rex [Planctomycetota bacterium]MBL7107036.1 redox-sensing transcriptional repressor Rex [Phycisphaerae bacterium]
MRYHKIPSETIKRLPVYLRGLVLLCNKEVGRVSSKVLAELVGINPWQIRKDFSYFGGFGTRGVGYEIDELIGQIKKILKIDRVHKTALVGVGHLGQAVLAYPGFVGYGFTIAAAYDNDPEKIGKVIDNIRIEPIKNLKKLDKRDIEIGIIAVPFQFAQIIADQLVEAGVKGILNFAPAYITVPKKVKIISIDFALDLACLPYYLNSK